MRKVRLATYLQACSTFCPNGTRPSSGSSSPWGSTCPWAAAAPLIDSSSMASPTSVREPSARERLVAETEGMAEYIEAESSSGPYCRISQLDLRRSVRVAYLRRPLKVCKWIHSRDAGNTANELKRRASTELWSGWILGKVAEEKICRMYRLEGKGNNERNENGLAASVTFPASTFGCCFKTSSIHLRPYEPCTMHND